MKVLVAGASGLIGMEVCKRLRAEAHFIRTLSRDPERARRLSGVVDEVRIADATRRDELRGIGDGIEVLISCLGAPVSPSAKLRSRFADVDLPANLALLEEAKSSRVKRFVYVGVHTEPGYADVAYVQAHTSVEHATSSSGLEHAFVRPTGVFGAFAELVKMAAKGPLPVIGDGHAETNPIHEADVARAVVAAAAGEGSSELDIGGPSILTRRRIAELAFEAIGRPPRLLFIPPWVMRSTATLMRPFDPRMSDLLRFVTAVSTSRGVAAPFGDLQLADYLRALAPPTS